MKAVDSIIDLVGGTPLVRLNNIVEPGMATVYAKDGKLESIRICKGSHGDQHGKAG